MTEIAGRCHIRAGDERYNCEGKGVSPQLVRDSGGEEDEQSADKNSAGDDERVVDGEVSEQSEHQPTQTFSSGKKCA